MVLFHKGDLGVPLQKLHQMPYSLKFSRGKYCQILLNNKFSLIKLSWSSFQPRLASINSIFMGRVPTCEIREIFNLKNLWYVHPWRVLAILIFSSALWKFNMTKIYLLAPHSHPPPLLLPRVWCISFIVKVNSYMWVLRLPWALL